ncbi:MAG: phenylalanine--tRNA ligase subunit beta [Deltaproteobacteria bacterium]|nr:MAG: phenylalanine--tRNA ligase subunit beta [Deltaproteobacteria bacterium]
MRVSLNWLKDYVDIDMSAEDLAERLTMSGLEVEALEPLGQSLEEILVAKILSIRPHPDADRLFICDMDTGDGEVPVVCSAPNLETGAMVPLALPGTRLPGGTVVEESQIRGERSVGMLLAEDEMGLTDDHTGIMILPSALSPGARVPQVVPLEDWALDISITPNRPDCACVMGVAREIAAITGEQIKEPVIEIAEGATPIEDLTKVTIDDPAGCPRYAAGMIRGVELRPSPFWLRYRLHASGVRGINNVVDVTNYVMLEMGQPLHAFDYDRLRENRIVVKRAGDGERFSTLDGQSHTLNREILMICDGERSVAVAGIMGGLNSEIFAGSKNVLVESAYFDPITIRRGSKTLAISTEASYRFERGIDIEGVITALRRALMLIEQLAGGQVVKGLIDNYPRPFSPPVIDLRIDKTNDFLGTSLSQKTIAGYLRALSLQVEEGGPNVIRVKPPTYRVDITREVDLMEEVARLEGYDRIPVRSPHIRPSDEADTPELILPDKTREIMVGLGFTEIITYSFISPDSAEFLRSGKDSLLRSFVKLLNPLSTDQSVMRTSLVPGLLDAIRTNIHHGEKDLKLFEWGKVFVRSEKEELPQEVPFLGAIMTGLSDQKAWYQEERNGDFYDIKGAVEALLTALGLGGFRFKRDHIPPHYHPEVSSHIHFRDSVIGHVGQILPEVMKSYDLESVIAYIFEVDIRTLMENMPEKKAFVPYARFPAVFRDISLIMDRRVASAEVQEIIENEGGELIETLNIYDLYEGGKMDPSEKALTFRICYRSKKGTLDGQEINRLHETIINQIRQKTGGRLREG